MQKTISTTAIVIGLGLLVSPALANGPKPTAKILSDNAAYHRVYVKDGSTNRVFGLDARIGVAGIIGRNRPQFLLVHYSDPSSNTIQYARLLRGGKVDSGRRMRANAKQLAKVFDGIGRPKMAQALRSLAKKQITGGPYRAPGVSFGGIWKDPGLGMTLPNGDRLWLKMEGQGNRKVGHAQIMGRPQLRVSYGLAKASGGVDRHQVVLHSTTLSKRQQQNNARKLNQALDFLEAQLVSAVQP